MLSFHQDFRDLNLFDCSDLDDLISPDPGARTVSTLFLEQYNDDDIFQFLDQYGLTLLLTTCNSFVH